MKSSIISINNTRHIALYNTGNVLCHYVTILQKLHGSPILNTLLSNLDADIKNISNMSIDDSLLIPVIMYAKLNESNETEIYMQIREALEMLSNYAFSYDVLENGYYPHYVLLYYYLPILYSKFPNEFPKIIEEIYITNMGLSTVEYYVKDIIMSSNGLLKREQDKYLIFNLYFNMIKSYTFNSSGKFCCGILEVYTGRNGSLGHAISLIQSIDNNFYIFDDQIHIEPIDHYLNIYCERIKELIIRDIDFPTIELINKQLKKYKFDYCLRRFVLKMPNSIEHVHALVGGNNEKTYIWNNMYIMQIFSIALVLVILLLIMYGFKNIKKVYNVKSKTVTNNSSYII